MLLSGVVQDTSDLHLGRVKFVFLAAGYIGLNFLVSSAIMIKLAATSIEVEAINVLNMDSCAVGWFLGQYVAPWIVAVGILHC